MSRSPISQTRQTPRPRRALVAVSLAALVAGASCAQIKELPKLTKADLRMPNLDETSRIYDDEDQLLRTYHGVENRTIVPLKRVPKKVQRAVVAIEDERFYEHDGVDVQAIFRAAFANAASGEIQEGGSTITQQYVKNVIIAPGQVAAKTLERKIDEAIMALQLEKKLSKKEILFRYLNTVYFGSGAYGIQAASKTYFRKPVNKLKLGEAALLAGLIRSPDTYSPYGAKQASLARRNLVLDKMAELGWAPEGKVEAAKKKGLGVKPKREEDEYPAPYFLDYVQRLLKFDDRFSVIGETPRERERALFTEGLRIYTTVDLDTQAAADESVDYYLGPEAGPHGSLVAIEPDTGHVKAMVGGFDYFASEKDSFAKLHLAIQAEPNLGKVKDCGATEWENRAPGCGRQAGSAYKPFALVAAIEDGIPLSKTYTAQDCMSFPEYDNWNVCNYEEADLGEKTLLEATASSINVVYAQLAIEVGFEEVKDTAEKMGITIPQDAFASSVLGTNSVNPLNMASAFGTLAAEGRQTPPVAIRRIENAQGEVLYEDETESEPVIPPAVAYVATSALEEVIESGTGENAYIGRPAAGKTGTAQEYRDAWFAGYTPDLTAAVWVGHPEGQVSMQYEYAGGPVFGGSFPALIWSRFMTQALAGVPATDFPEPDDADFVTVEIDTDPPEWAPPEGCLAGPFTPEEDREWAEFIAGTEPTTTCREEGEEVTVPDVLYWEDADSAQAALEEAGFSVNRDYETTGDYPPGTVVEQFPAGGTEALYGSTVTITLEGSGRTTIPSVLGMSVGSAEERLSNAGYGVDVVTQEESGGGPSGVVWKQDPASGTSASPGTTVTIYANP